jgi:hypothetical protein
VCEFLSALVIQGGEIYTLPEYTDAHEDLIRRYKLKDDEIYARRWIRVEFKPEAPADLINPERYKLTVDESETPAWFSDEINDKVSSELRARVERMIVREDRDILLGGCWIIGKGIRVGLSKSARIIRCSGHISQMFGGTVQKVCDGGTVQKVCDGGTVQKNDNKK